LAVFLLVSSSVQGEQSFKTEPEDVIAVEGERVVLGCEVKNKTGTLQWTRDDFGLGTDRDLSGFRRYKMLGRGEESWNLEIMNVTLEDDAKFQCQVGATDSALPIRSHYATLQVLSPPQPPVITAGPKMILKEGKTAMVQCISKGGKPAATIKWSQNGQHISEGIKTKVETMEDGKRLITVSTLTFVANRNTSGVKLECKAENPVEKEARIVSTVMEVEYPPTVTIKTDKQVMHEGEEVRITCSAEAMPEKIQLQWRIDGEEVEGARGATELVLNLDRNMHRKKVSCFVSNKIGQNSDDYILDVKYSPVWIRKPVDKTVNSTEDVELRCLVDSNPAPSYTWYKDDQTSQVVGEKSNLSIRLPQGTSSALTCLATVEGYPKMQHRARVSVRGPPAIVSTADLQFGNPGETVEISCEARSVPPAETMTWSYGGMVLAPGSHHPHLYTIVETKRGNTVRSTLVINKSDYRHFGEYGCAVANAMGNTSTVIQLRPLDALPLLIMIAGGIGALLLGVAIVVIFLTCRRVILSPNKEQWPRCADKVKSLQQDKLSNNSDVNTRTTSSLCGTEDLDGSDSLREYIQNQYSTNTIYTNYPQDPNNWTSTQKTYTSLLSVDERNCGGEEYKYRVGHPSPDSDMSGAEPSLNDLMFPETTHTKDAETAYNINHGRYTTQHQPRENLLAYDINHGRYSSQQHVTHNAIYTTSTDSHQYQYNTDTPDSYSTGIDQGCYNTSTPDSFLYQYSSHSGIPILDNSPGTHV